MWIESNIYRRRHRPNYGTQHESRYFVVEVDCTHAVSMILKATMVAVIVSVSSFLSLATPWTGLRGVCLGYKLDLASSAL